jgi:2Fe-2S ferredoxin
MVTVTFVEEDGNRIVAEGSAGTSLMQTAVNAGVTGIAAECGGAGACATCHCKVAAEWFGKLPEAGPDEADMLEFVIDPATESRLSCQIELTADLDGLVVNIPGTQV